MQINNRQRQNNLGFGAVGIPLEKPTMETASKITSLGQGAMNLQRHIGNIGNERNYLVLSGRSQAAEDAFVRRATEEGYKPEQKPHSSRNGVTDLIKMGQNWMAHLRELT